jgi:hypothetical protein
MKSTIFSNTILAFVGVLTLASCQKYRYSFDDGVNRIRFIKPILILKLNIKTKSISTGIGISL